MSASRRTATGAARSAAETPDLPAAGNPDPPAGENPARPPAENPDRAAAETTGRPAAEAPALIEVHDLVVRYGTATALDRVDLTVRKGELVALIGPNGAGKSSLVNAIMGIVRPAAGRVQVTGRTALVPEGRRLFPDLTVDDNLALGAWRRRRRPGARDVSRVYEVLPELARVRRQRAGTLSGGQQQMVAFGRALMAEPEVIVVDELSLGLAPLVTAELAEHLRELNAERGLAVLLIEQNAHLALDLCGRGYVLEAGRIRAAGTAAELAGSAQVAAAYLGAPSDPAPSDSAPSEPAPSGEPASGEPAEEGPR